MSDMWRELQHVLGTNETEAVNCISLAASGQAALVVSRFICV